MPEAIAPSGVLLLCLLILANAAVWPLYRWALRRGGTPVGMGIVLSVVTLAGAIVGALGMKQSLYHPASLFFGALGGVSYGAGFVLVIFRCLGTGPMAPTAIAQSLGLVGMVVATLVVPYAPRPSTVLYAGFGAALLAIVILGLTRAERSSPGKGGTGDWPRLVVTGWAFAALTAGTQFLSGRFAPEAIFGYIAAQALVSLLLLLIVASTGRAGVPRLHDLLAGTGGGILTIALVPLSATAIGEMEVAALYPVTLVAPMALLLIVGAVVYRERLSVWGWLASASGCAALVLLSLPRR